MSFSDDFNFNNLPSKLQMIICLGITAGILLITAGLILLLIPTFGIDIIVVQPAHGGLLQDLDLDLDIFGSSSTGSNNYNEQPDLLKPDMACIKDLKSWGIVEIYNFDHCYNTQMYYIMRGFSARLELMTSASSQWTTYSINANSFDMCPNLLLGDNNEFGITGKCS